MASRELKILHISDFHFGHNRTKTSLITANLRTFMFPKVAEVDLVAITGDVFDNIVNMTSSSAGDTISFFVDLFMLLKAHNVKCIILQGTTYHDRNQLEVIRKLTIKLGVSQLCKVILVPKVYYDPDLEASFLYLPDDLPYKDKANLFKHIRKLLITIGGKVDYVLCHGMFDFACPVKLPNSYTPSDFYDICNKLVLCGHVHTPQIKENIIYAGSFDRLAHGEEGRKGFWMVEGIRATFIKNEEATKYITFTYPNEDIKQVLITHDRLIAKHFKANSSGYIRLIINDIHIRQTVRYHHREKYPNITLSFKQSKVVEAQSLSADAIDRIEPDEQLEAPNHKNLSKLVHNHLLTKGLDLAIPKIDEVINAANDIPS